MKIKSMRLLDRWIGAPISFGLTLIRRVRDLFVRRPTGPPQRILVIKLIEQGATVVAEPAFRRATELVGRENVYVAVFRQNRPILDVLDIVPPENVITIRSQGLLVCAADTFRALRKLRKIGIDTVIDFEFFSRFTGALAYLSGAKRRIGFHSYAGEAAYRGDLMTHRLAYNTRLHASQIYQILVQAMEIPGEQLPTITSIPPAEIPIPEFTADPEEIASVEQILRDELGCETLPHLILFNANSGDLLPLRRWMPDRYVELGKRLLAAFPDVAVVFTGSPNEQAEAESLARRVGSTRCVSVGGKTTLRELLALYCIADVLVTNDSGPAHYASMTPIDVVTLFGPESPAVFGSRSERSHILWAGLACSPCVNAFNQRATKCTNNVCMQKISVDDVFHTVCQEYERRVSKTWQPIGEAKSASGRDDRIGRRDVVKLRPDRGR
jgi:ADP-heptose:LPS heptosyltransferase